MQISLADLPNFITSIRLLLTGPIIWTLLTNRINFTLGLFMVAAITDWLDGWLARRYKGWATELGAFLDPLTDKVLLISTFLTCGYLSYLPLWTVIIAVGRDFAIILGILIYHLWIGPLNYSAIFTSKVNTSLQVSLILLLLIQKTLWGFPDSVIQVNGALMVVASIVSFLQYAKIWISKIRYHVKRTR